MNPLAILGLVQLGMGLLGSFRASQEAARQQALMEDALNRQIAAATEALNRAAAFANKDISKDLAPLFSLLQGRALANVGGMASAAGLTGSGLAQAAEMDVRSQMAAAFGEKLADWEMRKIMPLLQAQASLTDIFGGQAQLRAKLADMAGQSTSGMFSWLPIALQAGLFNFGGPTASGTTTLPTVKPGAPGFFEEPRRPLV